MNCQRSTVDIDKPQNKFDALGENPIAVMLGGGSSTVSPASSLRAILLFEGNNTFQIKGRPPYDLELKDWGDRVSA